MKRTTTKLYGILLTVLAALVLTGSASVTTQAKTKKPYKTKTVKIPENAKKNWYPAHDIKIKKIKKVSKNKNFSVKTVCHNDGVQISGTDRGKKQAIKIYFKNGRTQKVNLKTEINYLNKIKAELKPMLAEPNSGLRTAISQWEAKLEKKTNRKYETIVFRDNLNANGNTVGNDPNDYTVEEAIQKMTKSQKKALVLEAYLVSHMTYSKADKGNYYFNRKANKYYAKLYKGTFKGVCQDGAEMAYDIAKAVGLTPRLIESSQMNHAWCVVKVTDTNGKTYWQGVAATSDTISMKSNYPKNKWCNDYTKKDINKWMYSPSRIYLKPHATKNRIAPSPTTPTTPSAVTASAIKCPGCTGKLSHLASNPYKSMCDGAVIGIIPMGSTTKYHPHNGGGVIRFFDDYGNEWLDVPADVKQRYEALYL